MNYKARFIISARLYIFNIKGAFTHTQGEAMPGRGRECERVQRVEIGQARRRGATWHRLADCAYVHSGTIHSHRRGCKKHDCVSSHASDTC